MVGAPDRWYARMVGLEEAAWTAPEEALGRDVFDLLPRGDGSGAIKRVLNEIQMVLHDHPVNRARAARGDVPVNSDYMGNRNSGTFAVHFYR